MTKHTKKTMSLGEIISSIEEPGNAPEQWWEIMEIEIEGLPEAIQEAIETDDYTLADELEGFYIQNHENDLYEITWPEHVVVPALNSDASFRLVKRVL